MPFSDNDNSPSIIQSSTNPVQTPRTTPNASQKPTVRKRARKAEVVASSTSSDSDSDPREDDDSLDPLALDAARYTVSEGAECDDMDIFSPLLPPDHRVVETKDSLSGLTLYKTAKGEWLSEAELERLANMARNAQLLKDLGIEEAKRRLTARPENDEEPEPEDDRDFSATAIRAMPPPREHHPRQSKKVVS